MRYFLDFDRVIFDVDAYYKDIENRGLAQLVVHPDVWNVLDAKAYVYPDAIDFLKTHDPNTISVITAMSPQFGPHAREFQKRKVQISGVEAQVGSVIFMEGLKGSHIRDAYSSGPAVFVDDKLEQVASVHRDNPSVIVVHMVRTAPSKEIQFNTPPFPIINSFVELDNLLSAL